MLITEFDQAEYEKIVEREKREVAEKAEAKGRAEERAEMMKEELAKAVRAVREGFVGVDVAADLFGVDPDDLEDALER